MDKAATIVIRPAHTADCQKLAALSIQVWLHSYCKDGVNSAVADFVLQQFTVQRFMDYLIQDDFHILVCYRDEHLLGYISVNLQAKFETPDNGYEIDTLYVQEHQHGQGIGRQLLAAAEARFGRPYWLSTWIHNTPAIGFYQHVDLKQVGITYFELDGEQHENLVFAAH